MKNKGWKYGWVLGIDMGVGMEIMMGDKKNIDKIHGSNIDFDKMVNLISNGINLVFLYICIYIKRDIKPKTLVDIALPQVTLICLKLI